jgi:ABC-type glycerol-3-phosphate transport system permease component
LWRIVVPVSLPSMASLAILQFLGVYNDYIWPLVTLSDGRKQLFAVGVTRFMSEGNLDPGPTMAGYVIGAVPLIVIFMFGMRYYVEGLTKGALKA